MDKDRTPDTATGKFAKSGRAQSVHAARRGGLRALATTLPKVTKRALGRRGHAEGALLAEWPSIVGKEIAARCRPQKLSAARPGRHGDGTLTLRVEAGFAVELQHMAPLLIERVNGYLGYRAVSGLRMLQVPAGRQPQAVPRPGVRPLDAADEHALCRRVEAVADAEVRTALERLGRTLRQRGG